jgi:hypothetical protein
MKTFLATAAIVTALAMPAFAEGDDASAKSGEPKGSSLRASTQQGTPGSEGEVSGRGAMGQGRILPRAGTTGAAPDTAKESAGSHTNVGKKTGVTTGGD